jgi:hypothetical protein
VGKEKISLEDFDFINKKNTQEFIKPKINHKKFLNVSKNTIISVGVSLAISAIVVSGYKLYQSNIDSKIAIAETIVKTSSAKEILNFIEKEKIENQKNYINNQLLINKYGSLKELIELLNKQQEVETYQNKNIEIYDKINKALNADILSINSLYSANPKTREEKIATYIDSNNVEVAKKWEYAITTNQFVYINNMLDLNKQIIESLNNIEQVKKEILEQIQIRIKNSDFDLNVAQNQFSKIVINQIQEQLNELNQVKKDLTELKNQFIENYDSDDSSVTKTDSNVENIITDKDVNEATEALNIYQNQIINQINRDRAKVEQLISEVKQQQNTQQSTSITNNQNNGNNSNVIVMNREHSFLDYYLMYYWLNATNPINYTTTNYLSETNYISNNNYQNKSMQVNTTNYKPVNIPKFNIYNINNSSYLNKNLEIYSKFKNNSFGNYSKLLKKGQQIEKSKINISEIKAKIEQSKVKVEQAKKVIANEMKKIETAKINKYDAAVSKSKSGNNSSWSKSSKSSSNFGSGSRSFSFSGRR